MSDYIPADWDVPANIVAGTTLRSNSELPLQGRPCWLNQVHGNTVVSAGRFESPPDADASVSGTDPEQGADSCVSVVRTADCLPALFCSPDGRRFAAAHAGWRGLAAGVLENTVAALQVDPGDLRVWLGPAISQDSFEVGAEVRAEFIAHEPRADRCFAANDRGRWQADLYGLARQRLAAAGVTRITGGGFCTFADKDRFFSYRRNPDCGRLVSFIGLADP